MKKSSLIGLIIVVVSAVVLATVTVIKFVRRSVRPPWARRTYV